MTGAPGERFFRSFTAAGACSAGAAVALGAFGAHGLRDTLPADMLAVFETAVRYQMYHSLALIAAGLPGLLPAGPDRRLLGRACWAFAAGTVLFCGSLYALALTGIRAMGAVAPAGGLALIAGWVLTAAAWLRRRTA